jgi:hypothetical protein
LSSVGRTKCGQVPWQCPSASRQTSAAEPCGPSQNPHEMRASQARGRSSAAATRLWVYLPDMTISCQWPKLNWTSALLPPVITTGLPTELDVIR